MLVSAEADFGTTLAAAGLGVVLEKQAVGGSGMVLPVTLAFLLVTCGAPDQMGVLFLGLLLPPTPTPTPRSNH